MTYCVLIFLIFISILIKGTSEYYNSIKIDLYEFLILFIVLKIIVNVIKNPIHKNRGIFYFLLYIFSIFLSLLINNSIETADVELFRSMKGVLSFMAWPLIFLLTATEVFTIKQSIVLNKLLLFIGYIMATNTLLPVIIYYLTGNTIGEFTNIDGSIRSFGFLTDQIGFALVYFVTLSVFHKKHFSTLIFLIAIFVTGTRGAIVFSIIVLISATAFHKQNIFSSKIFYVLRRGSLIFLILVIAWVSLGDKITSAVAVRFDNESIDNTTQQRFGAMQSGIKLFFDNPFFGVGIGRFAELVYNTQELSNKFVYHSTLSKEQNMRGYANPQNEFINILVNGGLFSFIMVILFIYNVLKNFRLKILSLDNVDNQLVAYIFIIFSLLFIQTSIYMFNEGITSFIFLILLGKGSAKSLN